MAPALKVVFPRVDLTAGILYTDARHLAEVLVRED